ncbi:MAG: hypothetical protein RIC14_06575 [Filomicrobium sp.]
MSVVISVHGTNDHGPINGDKWWQRGSDVHKDFECLVESIDGTLQFVPYCWSGTNSEDERFNAGTKLAQRMADLDAEGEKYVLIGHSHGGSVIAHALRAKLHENGRGRLADKTHLPPWIVIGTPFVRTIQDWFLFTRLENFGKSAYISLGMGLLAGLFTLYLYVSGNVYEQTRTLAFLYFLFPALLVYLFVIWRTQHDKMGHYKNRLLKDSERIGQTLVHLRHKDDEAINALMAAENIRLKIFSPVLFQRVLSFLAIAALPGLVFVCAWSPSLYDPIADWIGSLKGLEVFGKSTATLNAEMGDWLSLGRRLFNVFLVLLLAPPLYIIHVLEIADLKDESQLGMSIAVGLFVGLFLLLVYNYLIQLLVNLFARYVGYFLSVSFDHVATGQVRAVAFGDDIPGERAIGVHPHTGRHQVVTMIPYLPDELSGELSEFSDARAGETIAALRRDLIRLQESGATQDVAAWLGTNLSWRELVHTSYFSVPRFRKLLIYAVSQCDGFRPSSAFKADPDFELVASWYAHVIAKKGC